MAYGFDEDKSKVEVLPKSEAASKEDIENFQSQLDGKAQAGHNHDERYYTENEINSKLNGKQNTVTGGASSIVSSNLTPNRSLVSNSNGKVSAGSATANEVGMLVGCNGNVQGQFNQISVRIPSNYKLRAGTTVRNISGGYTYDLFTNAQLNQMLGVDNVSNLNTFVGVLNGDFEAHDNRADNVAYIASRGVWQIRFGDVAGAGLYRFNYIVVYFG